MKTKFKQSYQRLFAVLSIMAMMLTSIPVYAGSTASDFASRYITVDGKQMHVVLYGDVQQNGNESTFNDENKTTIVMTPGLGDLSPHLNFKPIAQSLDTDFNVVIVEPFGYGLSDNTSVNRSLNNINNELNEALDVLDIEECVLLVHSISGVYGLNFAMDYPEKLKGFIAIDNTVNEESILEQMLMEKDYVMKLIADFNEIRNAFPTLEDFRADIAANPAKYGATLPQIDGYTYPESDMEEFIDSSSRQLNDTIKDEVNFMAENIMTIKNTKFPDSLPVLLLVSAENVKNIPDWELGHRNQLNPDSPNHKMYILEGAHAIWYKNLEGVVNSIEEWKTEFGF